MALSFKIFSLVVGIVLLKLLLPAHGQSYTIGENSYRVISSQKVNWYRAYQLCAALGMQLASIKTESDRTDLQNALYADSLLSNNYWLAGNNLADRGEYVWPSSGRKFSYTKWAASQPGSQANRCVRTNFNFEWVSEDCNNANYFICSRPLKTVCGVYGGCSNSLNIFY